VGHEALSRTADLGNQRVMLLDALRHQRGERLHRLFDPFGDGVPPVLEKPRRDPRQRRQMVYGVASVIHRIAQDNAEFSGKGVGDHGFALDQAGIAVACFFPRITPVDQNNVPTAPLQMQRHADSHHSCSENDYVRTSAHPGRCIVS
jgi:hypothetical protein